MGDKQYPNIAGNILSERFSHAFQKLLTHSAEGEIPPTSHHFVFVLHIPHRKK